MAPFFGALPMLIGALTIGLDGEPKWAGWTMLGGGAVVVVASGQMRVHAGPP